MINSLTCNIPIRTSNRHCLLAFVIVLFATNIDAKQPGNEVGFYITQYGQIHPEQNPQVAKTFEIFNKVNAVADKSGKRLPKLVVVNSQSEPWAIALPDGHIVLSKQAIKICYTYVKETEACLAFILGHELAHLANDDFWHQEVYGFLATHKDTRQLAHFLKNNGSAIQKELAADDKGFIYAAMAGFSVAKLINNPESKIDFFDLWMQQTNSQFISQTAEINRSAPLKQRLNELNKKLVFYEFGIRLSHFGYYDDSVYFLKEFQKVFPGREVFNNLGYSYLQLAINSMDGARAWFYWLPLILDADTQSIFLSRGSSSFKSLKQAGEKHHSELLLKAVTHLKQAVAADPSYIPAKINLAVALLYLGRPHEARIPVLQLRELKPDNSDYAGLEALVLYEQSDSDIDLWPVAVKKLIKLVDKDVTNTSAALRYNLARLLEIRSKSTESSTLWQHLAEQKNSLPTPIRISVCTKQIKIPFIKCNASKQQAGTQTAPWLWPIQTESTTKNKSQAIITAEQLKQLLTWNKVEFDWQESYHLTGKIYSNPNTHAQVLIMGSFIQAQVLKNDNLGQIKDILSSCPQGFIKRKLAQGAVYSCGQWAVLVRNHEIQEAWWMAK